jgi:hypothetical protein
MQGQQPFAIIGSRRKTRKMKIKLYDRVLLKDGKKVSIVEIYEENSYFIADIDKDVDTYTEGLKIDEIERVLW